MNQQNSPYLPKVRTDYHPTENEIKSVSVDGNVSIDIPNPAVDNIVANNIACSEFDYTQDMMSTENFDLNNSSETEKNYINYCNN